MTTENTQLSPREALLAKWTPLLEAESEGFAPIEKSKHKVLAKIFENQEADFAVGSEYHDRDVVKAFGGFLTEAEIGGDHGYDATNIAAGQTSGAVTHIGPAVMGMVRRSLPNLIAFDICGVQPMDKPTGQIFSVRSVYGKDPLAAGAKEALHPMFSPDTMHSGQGAAEAFTNILAGEVLAIGDIRRHDFQDTGRVYVQTVRGVTVDAGATSPELLDVEVKKLLEAGTVAEIGEGMATSVAELQEGFNGSQNNPWNEMSFRIDKQSVEVKSRQLKAQYSIELAQDLKAVHGMDADAELAGLLATEIMLEINREIIDWINYSAQVGKTGWTQTPGSKAGVFDFQDPIDIKGARWAGESYKALLIQIDKEASEISRQTGRGIGNFIIASRNVVMALAQIDTNVTPAAQGLAQGMNYDTTKATFAGVLGGRYKVYIDQYARQDYFTVGFKGSSELDAGIYYSPYVPLTPLRGSDPKNMQPVMAFKTRYAIGINPFANAIEQAPAGNRRISNGMPTIENSAGKNAYFRKVFVKGI